MPRTTIVLQTDTEPTAQQMTDMLDAMGDEGAAMGIGIMAITALVPQPDKSTMTIERMP